MWLMSCAVQNSGCAPSCFAGYQLKSKCCLSSIFAVVNCISTPLKNPIHVCSLLWCIMFFVLYYMFLKQVKTASVHPFGQYGHVVVKPWLPDTSLLFPRLRHSSQLSHLTLISRNCAQVTLVSRQAGQLCPSTARLCSLIINWIGLWGYLCPVPDPGPWRVAIKPTIVQWKG